MARPDEPPAAATGVPRALWELHAVGERVALPLGPGWGPGAAAAVVEGGGFRGLERVGRTWWAVRERTLADTVGPSMRLLCVGLNPSLRAADAGIGFVTPGNRFWPAALAAGVVSRDRDPRHALDHHGVGMTDLVKRASARADGLTADEYRHGVARLERLCRWLEPGVVCIVGLSGWRAAVDRHAPVGLQEVRLGGRPVYVMPNPSGVNAHVTVDGVADHLRAAIGVGS